MSEVVTCLAVIAGAWVFLGTLNWLGRRFVAERCPQCGSRWRTALTADRDGLEDWTCRMCGHTWRVLSPLPYD